MTWTVDRLKKVRAEMFDLAFKERAQSLGRGLHPNEALSLVSEVERLTAEIERLTARLATAEKAAHEWRERAEGGAGVLQQVEWWTSEHLSGEEGECPVCRSWQSDGHASECALASLLASYPLGA